METSIPPPREDKPPQISMATRSTRAISAARPESDQPPQTRARGPAPVAEGPGILVTLTIPIVLGLLGWISHNATKSTSAWDSFSNSPTTFVSNLLYSQFPAPLLSLSATLSQFLTPDPTTLPLETWLERAEDQAWKGLLANIHPEGTERGTVVASPSKFEPDYWYQWTRDSALVMRNVVNSYLDDPAGRAELLPLILDYVYAADTMQHLETPSGGYRTGGLGEVKYHVDYTPFTGEWGRPQPDGPASRVITLIPFTFYLWENGSEGEKKLVREKLYDGLGREETESVIKADLEYVANNWQLAGYDLWEEVSGSHFYTLLSIYRALTLGSDLANTLSDPLAANFYASQAHLVSQVLKEFWSPAKNIIRVSLNQSGDGRESVENAHAGDPTYGKGSEEDSAVLLAYLHAGRGNDGIVEEEQLLATLDKLMISFSEVYPLNKGREVPALGRYPEDLYDGVGLSLAHPWFLCTLAASETLHLLSSRLCNSSTPLIINPVSLPFYSRFLPLQNGVVIKPRGKQMEKIVAGMRELGDGFLGIVQEFAGRANGSLSEQFDRVTGESRGARDLTWSYAALITAAQARRCGSITKLPKPRPSYSATVW